MRTGQAAAPAAPAPYAVLDESGKVREWIAAGRGLRVWVSHDLGAGRPDMLTPGDVETPPHWAYPVAASEVIEPARIVFFQKTGVEQEWSDSVLGWRAADKYARAIPASDLERTAPIGRVLSRFTVERLQYETTERVPMGDHDRPLSTHFKVGVIRWTAILRDQQPAQEPQEPRQ